MRRALEIFFRQRRQFLLLLALLPVVSLIIGLFIPQPYEASASIWAAKRYDITDATWASEWYKMLGVDNTIPAQAQAGALTELLNSRSFALQVANATDLPKHSSASGQQRDEALFAEISHNVKVAPVGNNLVTITYSNADKRIAVQVVAATVRAFATASQQLALQSGKELLTADQTQLAALKNDANQAEANLQAYLKQHPGEQTNANQQSADPEYQALSQQVTSANRTIEDLQGQIGQLQIQLTTIGAQPDAFFSVQDAASLVPAKMSRGQMLMLALAVGLAIALVVGALYLTLLMRADRAIYSAADVEGVLSAPVLAEIPAVNFAPPMRAIFAALDGRAAGAPAQTVFPVATPGAGR